MVTERKLRRRQLTEDGNVEITGRDLRERTPPAGQGRHHFIPAFYLRQWHGPDDKLIEYTIKHGKLIPKPVTYQSTQ
jgi:hypothetical protein